ncbi:MAG: hypothetical protein AVDCRST_MAG23-203, partial [uncultured Sphingosinicella sp.]
EGSHQKRRFDPQQSGRGDDIAGGVAAAPGSSAGRPHPRHGRCGDLRRRAPASTRSRHSQRNGNDPDAANHRDVIFLSRLL